MRRCKNCGTEKEDNEFFIRKRDDKPYGWCKLCVTIYSKERYIKYKQEAVSYLGGKCRLCGYDRYIGSLEFHHIDPTKKHIDYHKMRNWSFSRKKEELDKCVLVCSNCHKEVEAGILELPKNTITSSL